MNPSGSRDPMPGRRPASSMSTRPSSSASTRPPSSASVRPSSSASSVRPSTSASVRPSSSASSVRPSSTRPSSRATTRTATRLPNRPSTKQSLRLLPLSQDLVTQLTALRAENDEENFRVSVDFVSRNLDPTIRPALSTDMDVVGRQIRGHIQKSRILSEDTFADALDHAHARLKAQISELGNELDATITASRLPSHLQLLLLLSTPPKKLALDYAEEYMENVRHPPKPAPGLTWQDILAEEPFEGQHWQGAYGLPPGSTVEDWDTGSEGSTPSLSALDDLDDIDDSMSSLGSPDDRLELESLPSSPPPPPASAHPTRASSTAAEPNYVHRDIVEALQARQYWKDDWRIEESAHRPWDVEDVSTFGSAFKRALSGRRGLSIDNVVQDRCIHEHDAVREVLMGLQGRQNLMMRWNGGGDSLQFMPATNAPKVLHLTDSALNSVLSSFSRTATVVEHLRKFVSAIYNASLQGPIQITPSARLLRNQYRNTRTLEAFVEAVNFQLQRFDSWCAAREEHICKAQAGIGPPLIVSFLNVEVAVRDEFSSTFSVLQELVSHLTQRVTRSSDAAEEIWTFPDLPQRMSPSTLTSLLLDNLLTKVIGYASMGDMVTSRNLLSVFSDSAEPLWRMIGKWVGDGMPVHDLSGPGNDAHAPILDDEFFIEDNELPLLDPDFWSDGFVLRDAEDEDGFSRRVAVPLFLQYAAEYVLSAGKAVGLLRALGMSAVFQRSGGNMLTSSWPAFRSLLPVNADGESVHGTASLAVSMSVDDFSRLVYDKLVEPCKLAQQKLTAVLIDDCELWHHLSAMEGLLLMRRGDAISDLVDILFARMDSPQTWTDFHFLNSAFRDVIELGRKPWVDPSLVRISHRGKDKNIGRTVRAIDGLLIEYAVPFPLTYIFGPRTMQVYSSIFVFILQIRRAKHALERILIRGAVGSMSHVDGNFKVFYAMRSKLSWFINALLNFISTNVLHTQIATFHEALKNARSLDDVISLHDDHLGKIEGRCLLQANTTALHRAVTAILDMCLHFSDSFVAFAGDTTHDLSRQSVHMKRHRSRRQKRQRRNVIGFSQPSDPADPASSSSESELDEESMEVPETTFSANATMTADFTEESFHLRLDKMSSELDAIVRFIRRGVETLAAGASEAAPAFGVFAFALEDWDR